MISTAILTYINGVLNDEITSQTPVDGGDINAVYCIETKSAQYLLKLNSAKRFPDMFKYEAEGLEAIMQTATIKVPNVIAQADVNEDSFLLMEWIEAGVKNAAAIELLGQKLALLHRHQSKHFGFQSNNYIGSLNQSNKQHSSWSNFFIEERLEPLLKLAIENNKLQADDSRKFDVLFLKLSDLFDEEAPSLIHGDLWSGNYIIDKSGEPWLIDPAVYYGHREMDIAMSALFGGFGNGFYNAYNEAYPLAQGWQKRIDLWNLYPLLVHVNLFGGSYVLQLKQNLAKYI
ncbi:fructosamine kinase family protein [Mucilaginibacter litoreus]|uniref:Fructosamine kinase family protein n=1 Tax=Mucilaginibacter litoreus TaxID=1048221 RepID=A0ABW3AS57_9SPHI